MRELKGRIAVVTGAGSGIGRATSVALARRGCHLALVDIDAEALGATRVLAQEPGVEVTLHVADVADAPQMAALAEEVAAGHGGCHVLVNNAGVLGVGRFSEDRLEDIRWMVGVNLWGVIHGCYHFLPLLRAADEAHVVNVSSMAAFVGIPQNAVYSLTKGAIRSFSEALRAELVGTEVGVSVLLPGAVGTNIMDNARGAQAERLAAFGRSWFTRYMRSSPEAAARRIVHAIERDRARALVGADARTLDLSARLLPGRAGLVGRALDRVT